MPSAYAVLCAQLTRDLLAIANFLFLVSFSINADSAIVIQVNIAMLALRCVVWNKHESHTSVFIVKNVFGVGVALHELIAQLIQLAAARQSRIKRQDLATKLSLTTVRQQT